MKLLTILCLFSLPFISLANLTESHQNPTADLKSNGSKSYFISEQHGISVYGTSFSLEGVSYVSLEFTNTTDKDLRVLWSAQVGAKDVVVHMDGTIQAYMTIPAGQSIFFGKANSADPLLESPGARFEKAIAIHLEIK